MNKRPISQTEREFLRAQHRDRVARCTEDLQKRYAAQKTAAVNRQIEEEYFDE